MDIKQSLILKGLKHFTGEQMLRHYKLTHRIQQGAHRLTRIDCESGRQSLAPLRFSYGYDAAVPSSVIEDSGEMYKLVKYTSEDEPFLDTNCVKCKYSNNSSEEGILCYPEFSSFVPVTYAKGTEADNSLRAYPVKWSSSLHPDQKLYFYGLSDSPPLAILAKSHFQFIQPVDIDGDGADEIVCVNVGEFAPDKTELIVRIFSYDPVHNRLNEREQRFWVAGGRIRIKKFGKTYYSYSPRHYSVVDRDGDGAFELCVISSSKVPGKNGSLNDRVSHTAIIDLRENRIIQDRHDFGFNMMSQRCATLDLDADGKTELWLSTENGVGALYSWHEGSERIIQRRTIAEKPNLCNGNLLGDVNGDGMIDILIPPFRSYYQLVYPNDPNNPNPLLPPGSIDPPKEAEVDPSRPDTVFVDE